MSGAPSRAGRLALVTGASSGIGAATALALAAAGWSLVLHGRDPKRTEQLRLEAAAGMAAGAALEVCLADLGDDAGIVRLAQAVAGRPLQAVIHAAGMVKLGSLADTPVEVLDDHLRLNLRAPYALTRALLPALRAGDGHVVFVNSTAGKRANPDWAAYAASKFALVALADALRQEEPGLRVTSVYPGRTATPMQVAVHAFEGAEYDPDALVRPEAVAAQIAALLDLPRPSLVSDITVAPG